jgi:hypothetical protein
MGEGGLVTGYPIALAQVDRVFAALLDIHIAPFHRTGKTELALTLDIDLRDAIRSFPPFDVA